MATVQQVSEPESQPGNGKPSYTASAFRAYAVGLALLALTSRQGPDGTLEGHLIGPAVAQGVADVDATSITYAIGRDATERRQTATVAVGE